MNLEVGQVYRSREGITKYVLVLEVRDEQHERGLGEGYGDSACAWPVDPRQRAILVDDLHPFDVHILCDRLPSHGDARWELITGVRYILGKSGNNGPLIARWAAAE
jgi:hypothetical protein